ncbi:hypothetical protein VUR80DRAFT_7053 [Thermomyces stellatus]
MDIQCDPSVVHCCASPFSGLDSRRGPTSPSVRVGAPSWCVCCGCLRHCSGDTIIGSKKASGNVVSTARGQGKSPRWKV